MVHSRDYTDRWQDSGSLRRSILVTAILTPTLAAFFVGLRLYSQRVFTKRIHKEDWLIVAALFFSILFSISEHFQLQYGLGLHKSELKDALTLYKGYFIVTFFPVAIASNFSILFTKASILTFYLRFSVSKRFNVAVYSMFAIVIAYTLMGAFSFLYACTPMAKSWDLFREGTCININAWYGTLVALNVFTDLVLLLMPIWLLKPLRVGFAQKAAVAAILGTGSFVLGISIFRLYITVYYFEDHDWLFRYGVNYLWLIIEVNVAIICACLPNLRTLIGRHLPALLATPRPVPRKLQTIPVTQPRRDMRMTGVTVEHFEVPVHKPDIPGAMWIDSRASSVFFCSEPDCCEMGPGRSDTPSVYSTQTGNADETGPRRPTLLVAPKRPSAIYGRDGFI